VVSVERQAGRRIGFGDDDALNATGQRFERPESEDLRQCEHQR
jgi:hypothetical protein